MRAHNRVMFVDDEEGVRLSWNRFLSAQGFDVSTADDGGTAIDQLGGSPVDVVVADLKMPRVNGLELLEWLHARQPETRFILLTGFGNEDVERRARELGAYEYLNKPISPDALAAVVTAAMHLKLIPGAEAPTAGATAEVVDRAQVAAPEVPLVAVEAEQARHGRMRSALEVVGGIVAAPLMGLAFVIFLPVIGFVALFWFLGQSVLDIFGKPESKQA